MNKARPLLLERPGFFSAVRLGGGEDRRGAGERVVARQGRGALCIAGRNAPQGCGRPAGHCKGVQRTLKSTQDTPRAGKGHPQSGQGAPQSAWGTPERMGHRRPHGGIPGRTGHPIARRDTTGRTGHPRAHRGHRRAHRGHRRAHRGHPRAHRGTEGRAGGIPGPAGAPLGTQGHPWAQGGASKQSVCGRKKSPPAAARRGQKNLFLLREKNFKFFGKNS